MQVLAHKRARVAPQGVARLEEADTLAVTQVANRVDIDVLSAIGRRLVVAHRRVVATVEGVEDADGASHWARNRLGVVLAHNQTASVYTAAARMEKKND